VTFTHVAFAVVFIVIFRLFQFWFSLLFLKINVRLLSASKFNIKMSPRNHVAFSTEVKQNVPAGFVRWTCGSQVQPKAGICLGTT